MNISKIKALWALMTGGWSGLARYILTVVNAGLAKCDAEKCKKAATVALSVSAIIKSAVDAFAPDKYRDAATKTVEALNALALALEDGVLTQDEVSTNVTAISACVDAWKEVK